MPSKAEVIQDVHDTLSNANSLDLAWSVYEKYVLPKNAGTVQRSETKQAFYLGADWFFTRMLLAVEDEDAAERLLSSLGDELATYRKSFTSKAR